VKGVSCEALWNGLFEVATISKIERLARSAMKNMDLYTQHFDRDGASTDGFSIDLIVEQVAMIHSFYNNNKYKHNSISLLNTTN